MNQKRKTLKKVAVVSAVATLAPSSWTKPVLNTVVLPAHAQTSSNVVSVRRSIPFIFHTSLGFNFDKRAGDVFRISTTNDDSASDLRLVIQVSSLKEAKFAMGISSNFSDVIGSKDFYSEEELSFNPNETRSNTGVVVYDDFFAPSGQRYSVEIDLMYRPSESRIISTVSLVPN